MTIQEILKAGEALCGMIYELALQPQFLPSESYHLNSLGCNISSSINLIASINSSSSSRISIIKDDVNSTEDNNS